MTTPTNNRSCWPSWLCCHRSPEPSDDDEPPKTIEASPGGKFENGEFHAGVAPVKEDFKKEFERK